MKQEPTEVSHERHGRNPGLHGREEVKLVTVDAAAAESLYVAILINEINVDGPGHVPRFEESTVLLRAASDEEAERRALQHAHTAETSYANADGETVRWSFRELASIGPALEQSFDQDQLAAGVEVYSRSFEDLEAYRTAAGSPDAARWSPDLPGLAGDVG